VSPRAPGAGGSLSRCARRQSRTLLAVPLALTIDALLGEPPGPLHPVVWIGTAISWLVRRAPAGRGASLMYGASVTSAVVAVAALSGAGGARVARCLPFPFGLLAEAYLLKTMLSVRELLTAGSRVERHLDDGDLAGARAAVTALVSRDACTLDAPLLASAAIESLAENASDSIVAPLLYYAVGGLPAACAYRAANTLDAMIGYRGQYEYLGKTSAIVDDVLNLVPARLTALLLVAAGALSGGDVRTGISTMLRDRTRTASPNAGWPMSAVAGLLGTRLEKPGHYVLGQELPRPDVPAIDHAAEIVKTMVVLSVPAVLGAGWAVRRAVSRFGRRSR
jgi:adenosylcobinamide-phosphate synthase